jgi:3-deoxy-manno-octulosonate cytidylyltransferase (CMP-KDO synthetase)
VAEPKPIVIIPARLAATRLPNKPLADIHGAPMIVHVWRRAVDADIGRVVVATDSPEIAEAVRRAGGEIQMTRPDHQNGTDRIYEAVQQIDRGRDFQFVVNVQGDLPTIEPRLIRRCLEALSAEPAADIATLACAITVAEERTNPNVVKAIGTPIGPDRLRALYFTRATAPSGDGPLYHHIGMYAYTRRALDRFVALPPGTLEVRERLEQLRALEAGMRIDVAIVDTVPLGVDTPADLERARQLLEPA